MDRVIGVCFHGVGVPAGGVAPEDGQYFVSRSLFLSVLDAVVERPDVELSFDDGYASDVEVALPALLERGLSARFFPLAGLLGRPGRLDVAAVRELTAARMAVGSHGMLHRSWRGLDPGSRREELALAREILSAAAGAAIDTAACPFGAYDRGALAALRDHGYKRIFTSDRRRARHGAWLQPRYSVLRSDTVQSVREDILGPRPMSERVKRAAAARLKAWR